MAEREEDLGSDLREVEKEIEELETVYLETTGSKVRERRYIGKFAARIREVSHPSDDEVQQEAAEDGDSRLSAPVLAQLTQLKAQPSARGQHRAPLHAHAARVIIRSRRPRQAHLPRRVQSRRALPRQRVLPQFQLAALRAHRASRSACPPSQEAHEAASPVSDMNECYYDHNANNVSSASGSTKAAAQLILIVSTCSVWAVV